MTKPKTSASSKKASASPAKESATPVLIVLGYDEHAKPCAARFAALGKEAVQRIVKTIEVYDAFCNANDPHQEHDFGAFDADGKRVFFKIDYYDPTLTVHSAPSSDPDVTQRVITVMLAEEY